MGSQVAHSWESGSLEMLHSDLTGAMLEVLAGTKQSPNGVIVETVRGTADAPASYPPMCMGRSRRKVSDRGHSK